VATAAVESGEPKGSGFVVQVASLKSRGEADAIAKRLSSKGFPSFVTTPGSSGPKVFRVRVGKYSDRREAETVARRLEKEEQFKPWITR
jgi:cell division septation protein DedD